MFVNYDDETLDIEIKAYDNVGIFMMLPEGEEIEEHRFRDATIELVAPEPGREFYVDARPAERLDQVVLGTEVLRCARDDRAAGGAGR